MLGGVCGRYASSRPSSDLADLYRASVQTEDLGPSWNVAPTDQIYAVVDRLDKESGEVDRQLHSVRWGLVPSWAKDVKIGNKLINARVETIAEKPSWRTPYRRRRAVIPADGYYEWVSESDDAGKTYKQPYYLHPATGAGLSFAALYDWWPDPAKDEDDPTRWLCSAAIITCAATGPAGEVHDRTPVILPADRVDAWLDPALQDPAGIADVLAGIRPPLLGIRAVSREVNRVGTNGPELIEPIDLAGAEQNLQLTHVA